MRRTILNLSLFQIGWFSSVLSAAAHRPWIGALVIACVVGVHVSQSYAKAAELKLVVIALGIGAGWDSLLVQLGWLRYSAGTLIPHTAPYWIVLMWALFATLLNVSLRWLRGRWVLAALAGVVGGPLAYYGGYRLGALHFGDATSALMALAVGWALITPALVALSTRFDGYATAVSGRTP
jgi:hypothetical protein